MKHSRRASRRCYDARGRAVTPADPHLLPPSTPPAVRSRIADARMLSLRSLAIVAVVMIAVLAFRLVVRAFGQSGVTWADVAELGSLTAGLAIAYLVAAAVVRRRFEASAIRAWLSIGHCAACGYSLRGLKPEFDGCTVCPECGAAWRLARDTEPSPSPNL